MCRIAGIVDLKRSLDLQSSIVLMRDSMHRGGPDDSGISVNEEKRIALGHRRLSLIDLSPAGHQPMTGFSAGTSMIFNGEIYNFLELKAELKGKGYTFKSNSDTEVILAAYHAYGTACFSKFNGMFALAIVDLEKNKIILARDHAGIKPLYTYCSGDQLIFASEIKAFKALNPKWAENEDWKVPFLAFGHVPEPFTTLQNVYQLAKGSFVEFDLDNLSPKETVYHRFEFTSSITNLDEAVIAVRENLDAAVKRHLISDAPIGLFLSGGVDSSLLTLIANKYIGNNLKTLSIVFEDASLNEGPYQQMIVDRTNAQHHSFLVTEKEFAAELPDVLAAMDQPTTDGINSYFISKYARKYGLTAVLSGLGADEIFGGYPSFNRTKQIDRLKQIPRLVLAMAEFSPASKFRKLAFAKRDDLVGDYLLNRGLYTPRSIAEIVGTTEKNVQAILSKVSIDPLPSTVDKRNKVSWLETNLYMQNQLLKDSDFMSMWHGLEVRVPFLDKELMQTAFSIAPEIKFDPLVGKHLLIKAFDDLLPKQIWQRKKQGFTFPFYKWMKNVAMENGTPAYEKARISYFSGTTHWSRYWNLMLASGTNERICYKPVQGKVLFLSLTSFSMTGGIEKFNRAFLSTLMGLEKEGKLNAESISLHDSQVLEEYFPAENYGAAKGKKLEFMLRIIRAAKNSNSVVVGHLNLSLPALMLKKLFPDKKFVLITHGYEVWDKLEGAKNKFLQTTDEIIAVSNYTATKLQQVHNIAPAKIKILHNTVDPFFKLPASFDKPQYLRERYGVYNGTKVIFTLTRMSSEEKYKGYDRVIDAVSALVKKYPGLKYIIAGKADTAEKQRVEALISQKQLTNNIILAGFIKDEELQDHFKLADVFVMPSTGEGFGIVFIEAMACGLPVIAGNVDGSVDALQNGRLGKLINPADTNELANAIDKQLQVVTGYKERKDLQASMMETFGYPVYRKRLEEILI